MFESSSNTFRRPHEISDSAAADAKPLINMLDYFPAAEFEVFLPYEDQFLRIVPSLIYEHDFRFELMWYDRTRDYSHTHKILVINILERKIFRVASLFKLRERSQPKIIIDAIDRYSRDIETALSQTMKKLILARPKI